MPDEQRTDSTTWRGRAESRRSRAGTRRVVLACGLGLAVLVASSAYLLSQPVPAVQLTKSAKAFANDWPTMPVDDLCRTWFETDMTSSRQLKLYQIFERRTWLERRPALTYVLDELSADGRGGRSEYEIHGFPMDRRLKVYWTRVGEEWRVTAPSIPVIRDDPAPEAEER